MVSAMLAIVTQLAHPATVCAAIRFAKRSALVHMTTQSGMDNAALASVARVCNMIPESIVAIMPQKSNDPWWCIRDIVSPTLFVVSVPSFGIGACLALFASFDINNKLAIVATMALVYGVLYKFQTEFLTRYLAWAREEREKHS